MGRGWFWRRRWWATACLSILLTVQWSPYVALARDTGARATLSTAPLTHPLLVQLQAAPEQAVALPNFTPGVNGFRFSNQELIEAIDLDKNAARWEEVLTEQLQKLFGNQVCIGAEAGACVLTSAAQDWLKTQLERMDLGIAEGMATAALALWQPDPQPQIPWWQRLINFLLGRTVFGLARSLFELQTFVANFFLLQSVEEVFQPTQVIRDTLTPTQIVLNLLEVFLTGSLDPFTMGLYQVIEGALTQGHTLTPYRVEDKGDGRYWVYVYDSNYPAERSVPLEDLHVEFNTLNDTWWYQPEPAAPLFQGDAQSKTLDLSHLSWRQSQIGDQPPAVKGPFTCPFCQNTPPSDDPSALPPPAAAAITLTLVGEGQMTVAPYPQGAFDAPSDFDGGMTTLVPFRGGLHRPVPASYKLPTSQENQPLQVRLEGSRSSLASPSTLQLTAPGYTADFEGLVLSPTNPLTLYFIPRQVGPELTFVAQQSTDIPKLSIHLTDDTQTYRFDASTPAGFAETERRVAKSSGFEITGLKLPAGKRVGVAALGDLKRLYFADDDGQDSRYQLTVKNRMVIRDRIQLGERNPDFIHYTLTYEEELTANNLRVEAQTQAFFDYDPAFIDPADRPREELIAALDQRDFPITLAYEPLSVSPDGAGPIALRASSEPPIGKRIFQASLRKAALKGPP